MELSPNFWLPNTPALLWKMIPFISFPAQLFFLDLTYAVYGRETVVSPWTSQSAQFPRAQDSGLSPWVKVGRKYRFPGTSKWLPSRGGDNKFEWVELFSGEWNFLNKVETEVRWWPQFQIKCHVQMLSNSSGDGYWPFFLLTFSTCEIDTFNLTTHCSSPTDFDWFKIKEVDFYLVY